MTRPGSLTAVTLPSTTASTVSPVSTRGDRAYSGHIGQRRSQQAAAHQCWYAAVYVLAAGRPSGLAPMCRQRAGGHGGETYSLKGLVMNMIGTKSTSSPTARYREDATTRDPRTFWRVGLALALPIGPLLVTIARAMMPYWTSQDDTTIAANIAAHPKTMELMNWIGLPRILPFMLITVLGLGYVARRGAPVLAAVGTIPAFFAYAMWNSAGPSDYLGWVMSTHGYSVDQMVTLSRQLGDTASATFVGMFWVVVHILGMVIAAIALRRGSHPAAVGRDSASDSPNRCTWSQQSSCPAAGWTFSAAGE